MLRRKLERPGIDHCRQQVDGVPDTAMPENTVKRGECRHGYASRQAASDPSRDGVNLDGEPSPIDETPLTETAVGALFSGRLAALLAARRHVVSTLVTEVMGAVRDAGDVPVTFMDWSGGLRGYASGEAESDGAMSRAWQDGVDLDAIVAACDLGSMGQGQSERLH